MDTAYPSSRWLLNLLYPVLTIFRAMTGGDWDDRYDVNSVNDVRSMNKQPAVYILASKRNGTLYVGVTSDLVKRVWEHSNNVVEGFTSRYGVHFLVYFEMHDDMEQAILREKRIKKWNRDWKIELIEKQNPEWTDLWPTITL